CDCANAVSEHIGEEALRLMLAAKADKELPQVLITAPVPPKLAQQAAGRYRNGDREVDLIEREGRLFLLPARGGALVELRALEDHLILDGPLAYGTRIDLIDDTLKVGIGTYKRIETRKPDPCPEKWKDLIGEYGPDHDTLYILEKDGKLHALIEWFFLYPLDEISEDVYRFPDDGMYDNQTVIFERDASGRVTGARAAE